VLQHETFGLYAECRKGGAPRFESRKSTGRINVFMDLFLFGDDVNTVAIFKTIEELNIDYIYVKYMRHQKAWICRHGEWERA